MSLCAACDDSLETSSGGYLSGDSLSLAELRCVQLASSNECAVYGAAIHELIARPRDFHGKRVRVLGYAHAEFESSGLYAHREDFEHAMLSNGLWLSAEVGDSVQDKYVLAEGTFNARMRGHLGMWSGSLVDVTRLETHGWIQQPPLESIPAVDLTRQPKDRRE